MTMKIKNATAPFKEQLLGSFDKRKELSLILGAPLEEGYVAVSYCANCGSVMELTEKQFAAFLESAEVPIKPSNGFHPVFYFKQNGCSRCDKSFTEFQVCRIADLTE